MSQCESNDTELGFDIALGAHIRQLRKMRGLSQSALGDACGVTFQQIQKYETGKNSIRSSMLVCIATTLRIPVELLLHNTTNGNTPLLSSEEQQVLEAFSRIPPAKREAFMLLVNCIRFAPPLVPTQRNSPMLPLKD